MTVADQIADFLASNGCTHAFGIVGGANLALFEAISKKLTVVPMCHEQAAAMAANYHYRVSGRIAPVLPTNGGGTMNVMTGVVEAHMDGTPMLIISGNEQTKFMLGKRTERTIGFQGVDPEKIVQTYTKQAAMVDNALAAKHTISAFYRIALQHRQGACWMDVPQDVATALAE